MGDVVVKVANVPDEWGDTYSLDVLQRIAADGGGYYMDGDKLMKRVNLDLSTFEVNTMCSMESCCQSVLKEKETGRG